MRSRRLFLKQLGGVSVFSPLVTSALSNVLPSTEGDEKMKNALKSFEPRGWKQHMIKQGDGKGGWVVRLGQIQFHHYTKRGVPYHPILGQGIWAFGVTQMDNGELILLASWDSDNDQSHGTEPQCEDFKGPTACEKPMIAFSRDQGKTWTEFQRIKGGEGRPVMLTYLGKGNLMFQSDRVIPIMQYFSSDYGRTWDRSPLQLTSTGQTFMPCDSNTAVDYDANGVAERVGEIGYIYGTKPTIGMVRWSDDGGRTWNKETIPPQWQWQQNYQGQSYTVSTSEGSLVRAANGWLVAALRSTLPHVRALNNGGLSGTVTSISKDDGSTWSPIKILFEAGRHHAHLLRLPNGDIVMTLILRQDVQNGKLASYRRGCEAVISHDNGQTWDVAHKYILDEFSFSNGLPLSNPTGHLFSTLLDDGFILTCYGHYPSKGACLIRWKPVAS